MDPAPGNPPHATPGPGISADRGPPVEHSRLAAGCLWGVPVSLGLWFLILYALWRLVG